MELEEDVRNLQAESYPNQGGSVEALEKTGKPAVDYLIQALKDPNAWVRYVAAEVWEIVDDSCRADYLIDDLKDGDQDVRFAVTGGLDMAGSGDARATETLMQVCDGDTCPVRITAEEALPLLNQKK